MTDTPLEEPTPVDLPVTDPPPVVRRRPPRPQLGNLPDVAGSPWLEPSPPVDDLTSIGD